MMMAAGGDGWYDVACVLNIFLLHTSHRDSCQSQKFEALKWLNFIAYVFFDCSPIIQFDFTHFWCVALYTLFIYVAVFVIILFYVTHICIINSIL